MTAEDRYGTDRTGLILSMMEDHFGRVEATLGDIQQAAVVIDVRTRANEAAIAAVQATCEERGKYCPAAGRPEVMFSMQAGTTRPGVGVGMAQVASALTPKAWAVIGTGLTAALVLVQLLERVVVGFLNHLGAAIK